MEAQQLNGIKAPEGTTYPPNLDPEKAKIAIENIVEYTAHLIKLRADNDKRVYVIPLNGAITFYYLTMQKLAEIMTPQEIARLKFCFAAEVKGAEIRPGIGRYELSDETMFEGITNVTILDDIADTLRTWKSLAYRFGSHIEVEMIALTRKVGTNPYTGNHYPGIVLPQKWIYFGGGMDPGPAIVVEPTELPEFNALSRLTSAFLYEGPGTINIAEIKRFLAKYALIPNVQESDIFEIIQALETSPIIENRFRIAKALHEGLIGYVEP